MTWAILLLGLGLILVVAGYLYLFQWIASLVSPALISNFTPGPWDRKRRPC